jgi:cobalamin biosynthesis protein CobT
VAAQDGFVEPVEYGLKGFMEAKDDVNSQIGTLRRKLTTALQVRTQVHFQGDKEDGELDQDSLYTLKQRNPRVFAQQTQAVKTDTAITLLVDLSGSMGHSETKKCIDGSRRSHQTRAWYAMRTAVALAETLNSLGVPFEVLGFHNGWDMPGSAELRARWVEVNGATRWAPFHITPFKRFDEAYRRCRCRFSNFDGRGNNGDGDAVMFAAKRLAQRPEKRKMLIVISDGQPAGPAEKAVLQADLNRVIKEVTTSGIEVYGIGANTTSVEDYYNKHNGASHVVIDDLDKLAVCVFKLIRARLLKAA